MLLGEDFSCLICSRLIFILPFTIFTLLHRHQHRCLFSCITTNSIILLTDILPSFRCEKCIAIKFALIQFLRKLALLISFLSFDSSISHSHSLSRKPLTNFLVDDFCDRSQFLLSCTPSTLFCLGWRNISVIEMWIKKCLCNKKNHP